MATFSGSASVCGFPNSALRTKLVGATVGWYIVE